MAEIVVLVLKLAIMVAPWLAGLLAHGLATGVVPDALSEQVKALLPVDGESAKFVKDHTQ